MEDLKGQFKEDEQHRADLFDILYPSRYMIKSNSRFTKIWDLCIVVVVAINLFHLPL